MNSSVTDSFRKDFARLPKRIQALAKEKYRLWQRDPRHPSLHFKKVGEYWSVRIDNNYRAIGRMLGGTIYWFHIRTHDDYEELI